MARKARSLRVDCRFLVNGLWVSLDTIAADPDALIRYYLSKRHLGCCDVQGGFFIELDGKLWNEGGVDEPWMTDTWFAAIDELLSGEHYAVAAPWEESHTALRRYGDILELRDAGASGHGVFPAVRVDFCDFVGKMITEGMRFAELLARVEARTPRGTEQAKSLLEEIGLIHERLARLESLRARAAMICPSAE